MGPQDCVWILCKTPSANGIGAACHMPQPDKGPFALLPTGWPIPKEGIPARVAWKEAQAELIHNCRGQNTQPLTSAECLLLQPHLTEMPQQSEENPTASGRNYQSRLGGEINYRK